MRLSVAVPAVCFVLLFGTAASAELSVEQIVAQVQANRAAMADPVVQTQLLAVQQQQTLLAGYKTRYLQQCVGAMGANPNCAALQNLIVTQTKTTQLQAVQLQTTASKITSTFTIGPEFGGASLPRNKIP